MVRNTFKGINDPNITADVHDTLVRLFSRKTTFNYQNHKIYPNQATRPEWAHRLGCWACEKYLKVFNLEIPEHALITCPISANVRSEVLRDCGLIRNPQQTTHTHTLWGQFLALANGKSSTFFGNFCNNLITAK